MGTGPEGQALVTREHREDSTDGAGASLARVHREALASIKRELGAIIVFGALFAWLVVHWTEGLEEAVLLAGYGVGAALWIRVRVYGLLRSVHRARGGRDGAEQE